MVELLAMGSRPEVDPPLLVMALFSNNPAYLLQAYFHKTIFFYVDLPFTPLFHGFFDFSVLVMLDSIIRKSVNLAFARAGSKAAIALAKWFCEFLQTWRGLNVSFSGRPPMGYDGVGWILGVDEFATMPYSWPPGSTTCLGQ